MINLSILGATGSIGQSTLSVVDLYPDTFRIFALSAECNWQKMATLCRKYRPRYAVMTDEKAAQKLKSHVKNTTVLSGNDALDDIVAAGQNDYVMMAIVGSAGISATLCAARAGKRIFACQ